MPDIRLQAKPALRKNGELLMSALNQPANLLLAALAPLGIASAQNDGFTDQFPIAACDFQILGGNSYLCLEPGRQLYLNNRRYVDDGELEEVSLYYVASCAPMNDVYYFGEDVEDSDGNRLPDSWLAGKNGTRPWASKSRCRRARSRIASRSPRPLRWNPVTNPPRPIARMSASSGTVT